MQAALSLPHGMGVGWTRRLEAFKVSTDRGACVAGEMIDVIRARFGRHCPTNSISVEIGKGLESFDAATYHLHRVISAAHEGRVVRDIGTGPFRLPIDRSAPGFAGEILGDVVHFFKSGSTG